jgi:hypothetical protein
MCEDCNPIESNTGVIQYSGPNLIICNGNTITNGELLTSVIAKIDNCIGVLQNQLDFTGLVENSPCIDLTKTSLQTVLQSILNTESAYCTQLQNLNTQLTNLQNQVNNLVLTKPVTVTACDPSRVTFTPGTAINTFKLNGLVPPKTILPYFGPATDFSPTGLGLANTPMAGWAIANGNNGTIKVIDTVNLTFPFIKYGPSATTTLSGSNTVTLDSPNIPATSFNVNANFDLNFTGETDLAGKHRHKLLADDADGNEPNCVNCTDGVPGGDAIGCGGSIDVVPTGSNPCWGDGSMGVSGEHSHTFTINSTATGSFSAIVGSTEPESFSIIPSHIQAIPIQWVGCV